MKCGTFLLLILLGFSGSQSPGAFKQGSTDDERDTVAGVTGKRLDAYFTRITPFGFSGVVLVARGDSILLCKGYGMANRAEKVPNTSGTVLSIGSITKQFTAAAIMTLEMQGKLNTQDPVSSYLDGVPPDKSNITIHNLLTHTSGLVPDVGQDYDSSGRDETVKKILALPLESAPGERFAYSNVNYTLLAAIIEHVSGETYEGYLQSHLFKPAGMEWTGYRVPVWNQRSVSHWYRGEQDNGNALSRPFPFWNLIGNGGILTTARDMFRWHQALLGKRVLSDAAKKKLFTPFLNDYAYGWDVLKTERGRVIQHNGGSPLGNNAEIRRYPDTGIVTILLCNQNYHDRPLTDAVRRQLEKLAFGESVPAPPEVSSQDSMPALKYEGVYTLPTGGQFLISGDRADLSIRAQGQDAINALVFPDGGDFTLFKKLSDTSVTSIRMAIEGNTKPLESLMENGSARLPRVLDLLKRSTQEGTGTGRLRDVTSMGTFPAGMDPGAVETRVVLDGEDGTVNLRLIWHGMRNIGIGPLDDVSPLVQEFVPAPGGRFVSYDLSGAKTVFVRFALSENGSISTLTFPNAKPPIAARRRE